jgi:hypothetical protein
VFSFVQAENNNNNNNNEICPAAFELEVGLEISYNISSAPRCSKMVI